MKHPVKMAHTLIIRRHRDTGSQRHGGYRTYRNYVLSVDGKIYARYNEDSPRTDYARGERLQRIMKDDADNLIRIFGGTLQYESVMDTRELNVSENITEQYDV
jgi:hypothetical protein